MKHFIIILAIAAMFVGCGKPASKENVMGRLQSLPEYSAMYYTPIHIGRQVLTGENHENPKSYIDQRYGALISEGLMTVEIQSTNAWRTVIFIALTDKAQSLLDPRRSDEEHAFVAVCRFRPVAIDTLMPLAQSPDSLVCHYVIEQQDITPFGTLQGFAQGKQHKAVINISK